MYMNNTFQSFINSTNCEGYWAVVSRLCSVALLNTGMTLVASSREVSGLGL